MLKSVEELVDELYKYIQRPVKPITQRLFMDFDSMETRPIKRAIGREEQE